MCSCVGLLSFIILVVRFIHVTAHRCDLFILIAVLCDYHNLSALVLVDIYFISNIWPL